jgi:hypothetical protein
MKCSLSFACSFSVALLLAGCGSDPAEPFSGSTTLAAWCDVANSPCCDECDNAPPLVLSIVDADTNADGDGTLTLSISGDLDDISDEILTVTVEGLSLGTIFNGNPNDDDFDFPGDRPDDCTVATLSAPLPLSALSGIVADGRIDITLTPGQTGSDINDEGCDGMNDEMVTATVEYPVG